MNYTELELIHLGLIHIGNNVRIHKSVEVFNPHKIHIGDNCRIDAFCLLSAGSEGIHLGRNIHIGVGSYIFGGSGKVVMEDFSSLSSRVSLYTATDDYIEGYLTNPTVDDKYKKVKNGPITLRRHVIVGSSSTIMPNVEMSYGAAAGAYTLITRNVPERMLVVGRPMKEIRKLRKKLPEMEAKLLEDEANAKL